jgi:hypothetical protein
MRRNRVVDAIVIAGLLFTSWWQCVQIHGETYTKEFGEIFLHRKDQP